MKVDGNREPVRSEAWTTEYTQRATDFAKAVASDEDAACLGRRAGLQVAKMNSDMLALNEIYPHHRRRRSAGEFVDVWDGFVDETGAFVTTGPDINGQPVRLRAGRRHQFHRRRQAQARLLYGKAPEEVPRRNRDGRRRGASLGSPAAWSRGQGSTRQQDRAHGASLAVRSGARWRHGASRRLQRRPRHGRALPSERLLSGRHRARRVARARRRLHMAAPRGQLGAGIWHPSPARRRPPSRSSAVRPRSARPNLQRGRTLDPIRLSSMARAAWRPSRIAQTTSDWPRRTSPAAKSLSTLVR